MGAGASAKVNDVSCDDTRVGSQPKRKIKTKEPPPIKAAMASKTPLAYLTEHVRKKKENKNEFSKLLAQAPEWTKYPKKVNLELEKGKTVDFTMRLSADPFGFDKRNIKRNELLSPWHPKRQAMRSDLPHPSLKLFVVQSDNSSTSSNQDSKTADSEHQSKSYRINRQPHRVQEYSDESLGTRYLVSDFDDTLESEVDDPNSKLRLAVIDWINTRYRKEIRAEYGRMLNEEEAKAFIKRKNITYRSLFYWNPITKAQQLTYDLRGRPINPYPCGKNISICDRGFYFFYGENLAVDCLVTIEHQRRLFALLIYRADPPKQSQRQKESTKREALAASTISLYESDEEPPEYDEILPTQQQHSQMSLANGQTTHTNAGAGMHTPSKDRRRSSVVTYFSSTKAAYTPSKKTHFKKPTARNTLYETVWQLAGANKKAGRVFEDNAPCELSLAGGMLDLDENEGIGKASRAMQIETGFELDYAKLSRDKMIRQVSYGIVQGEARTTRNAWTMSQFVHVHFQDLTELSNYLMKPAIAGSGGPIAPLFLDVRYVLNRHVIDGCEGRMYASHGQMFLQAMLQFATSNYAEIQSLAESPIDPERKRLFDVTNDLSYLEYKSSRLNLKKELEDLQQFSLSEG